MSPSSTKSRPSSGSITLDSASVISSWSATLMPRSLEGPEPAGVPSITRASAADRPFHRRPDRGALRDHPGRAGDRRAADDRDPAARLAHRLLAAAPPGPSRLAALHRDD